MTGEKQSSRAAGAGAASEESDGGVTAAGDHVATNTHGRSRLAFAFHWAAGALLVVAAYALFSYWRGLPGKGVAVRTFDDDTRAIWLDSGFVQLEPALRLPSRVDGLDRIEIWVRFPPEGKISARWLPEQQRNILVYPPGTVADRVEMPDGQHVVDVRGTELGTDGAELFHVYRREGDGLRGFIWERDNEEQQEEATRVLLAQVKAEEHAGAGAMESIRMDNDCASCHEHGRAEHHKPIPRFPNRGTDGAGFYAVQTVLADRAPVERHRPREMNHDDPYVSYRCGGGDAQAEVRWVTHRDGTRWPQCDDKSNPVAIIDVAAALAAGDDHARKVCASRKALFDRMDGQAREAFAGAFHACGILD